MYSRRFEFFSRWPGTPPSIADRKYRGLTLSIRFRTRSTTVPDRYHRHTPRSSPLPLDATAERFGFFNPLALNQVVIRLRHRAGRAVINPKANETRTGRLATTILGACDPGSKGLSHAPRPPSLQSGQAWLGASGRRLAAFELPSIRALGAISARMGGPGGYSGMGLGMTGPISRKAGYAIKPLTRPTILPGEDPAALAAGRDLAAPREHDPVLSDGAAPAQALGAWVAALARWQHTVAPVH
jgi:hypothetical protein